MFREQFLGAVNIVLLAGAEAQFQRLSLGIYRQMQLRAEPASRAPEGFSVRLFSGAARAHADEPESQRLARPTLRADGWGSDEQ